MNLLDKYSGQVTPAAVSVRNTALGWTHRRLYRADESMHRPEESALTFSF